MNEQKKTAVGIAALIAVLAVLVGILFLPPDWPFANSSSPRKKTYSLQKSDAQQRRILLLYHTDHEALLKAGREILKKGPKDPMKYRYTGIQHVDGFPVPRRIRIPKVIRKLKPHATLINRNGYIVVQMLNDTLIGYGIRIYPEGFKAPRNRFFSYGHRELLPGLWYYDYKYRNNPEYDKIIDEIIEKGKNK
jgi:hypothetical protein